MVIRKTKIAASLSQAVFWGGVAAAMLPALGAAQTAPATTAAATAPSASGASGSTGDQPQNIAQAQTGAPATATQAPVASPDEPAVEQVIVTAQSRTQAAQAVPISLQVITMQSLDKLQATNLSSINGYVPGLTVDGTEPTQPEYTIRGISNADFGVGTDSPVGVYVDGVYSGKNGGALLNFNDIQRVEVLMGPQGTLFGRNSAAGAISIVTNEPTHDFDASATVRVENYGTEYLAGMLNMPIADHLAARISLVTDQSNGWITNQYNNTQFGNTNDWGTRMQLLWDGLPNTKVVLGWEHEVLDQHPVEDIGIVNPPALGAAGPLYPNIPNSDYINPVNAPLYNDVMGGRENRNFDGVTLRVTHDFGWAEFGSTTAYRHYSSFNRNDRDGTDDIWTYFDTANIEGNTSWQQEFTLKGKTELVDWVSGASLYFEHANQASQLNTFTDTLNTLFNNDAGLPLYSILQGLSGATGAGLNFFGLPWQETMYNHGDYRAQAIYGDLIWHLTPQIDLTTGARFTQDEKEMSWYEPDRTATALDSNLNSPAGMALLQAIATGQAAPFGIPQIPLAVLNQLLRQNVLLQTTNDSVTPFTTSKSWSDFSPRAVLAYHPEPNTMIFGSVTQGYQAGGFNTVQVNSAFAPETVTNYEIGVKTTIPAYRLLLSASVFDYKFNDLQSLNLVPSNNPLSPPAYQVVSSNESAKGLDFQARWRPVRPMTLYFTSEYINQRYDNDTAADGTVLNGAPVGTPFWTAATGVDYVWHDLIHGGSVDLTVQGTYTGPTRCNADSAETGGCLQTSAFDYGEATHRIDFRLGWDAPDHSWGLALFVNNVFNDRYVIGLDLISATKLGTPAAQVTPPRTIGLEATMHL